MSKDYQFHKNSDYKLAFIQEVEELIELNIEDRTERMIAIDNLTKAYVRDVDKTPPSYQLERLANYILKEELTDKSTNKHRKGNSILSDDQLDRRMRREVQFQHMETMIDSTEKILSDGRRNRK